MRKHQNGLRVEAWLADTIGYRAVRYKGGVVVDVLYAETVPAGSPAAWLDRARVNAIRHLEAAKVNPKK